MQGDARSQLMLGIMLHSEEIGLQDGLSAADMFTEAAAQVHQPAVLCVSLIHLHAREFV